MRAATFRAGKRTRLARAAPASLVAATVAATVALSGLLSVNLAQAASARSSAGAERTGRSAGARSPAPDRVLGVRPIPKAAVPLTSGASAYPSATTVLATSSGAYVFESEPRGGNGEVQPTPAFDAVVWKNPSQVLTLAVPTTGTAVLNPAVDVSVAGSTVSVLENGRSHPKNLWVFTENLLTGSVETTALPSGYVWQGASRDGYLATVTTGPAGSPATTVLDMRQQGAPVQIGQQALTGFGIHLLAGPASVAVEYYAKPQTIIEYAAYGARSPWQRLSIDSGSWSCTSITAFWLGCYDVVGSGSSASTAVYDFSLDQHESIEPPPLQGTYEDLRVLPTADALFWSYCQPSGCTLTRLPDSSTTTATFAIPGPDVFAADQEAFFGIVDPPADPASGGIFGVSETGSGEAQLEAAPLSPVAAAGVSVTGGPQPSVAYVDNGAAGLGVFRAPVTAAAGKPPVVGKVVEAGTVGFAAPGGPASAVSLSDGATSVAYSTDAASGTGATVGLAVAPEAGSGPVTVTSTAPEANDVTVWGPWVSWLDGGVCHLYDASDRRTLTPALSDLGGCAVGAGRLAFIGHGGGVYVLQMTAAGPKPVSDAVQMVGPRRGLAVTGVAQLYLAVGWVGWDFSYTAPAGSGGPGVESAYRSFRTMQPVVGLPRGQYVEGMSASYVCLAWTGGVFPTARNLETRSVTHLGQTESSMSLAGDLVAWVGPGGTAWLYQLPG